jgi:hypothetical protein
MIQSVRYHFSQRFKVPALKAYEWCTNYDPQDHALMRVNAKREILHVSDSTIILTDIFYDKKQSTEKQKLVCLYPSQLTWTSTHLTGPNKYSQFLYQIVPENERTSRLDFTGLQIQYNGKKRLIRKEVELLAEKLRSEDSAIWKLLATEMEREFKEKMF